jgi:hypothetical protein
MKYNVTMPNKGTITDGAYSIFVTGETSVGYCYPDELNPDYNPDDPNSHEYNVDVQLSASINLKNCGGSASPTTTTIVFGSTTTTTVTSPTTTTSTTTTISETTTTTTTTIPTSITTTTEGEARGGDGCPILKAFDGNGFVEIEKLNIHSPEDQDTTYTSTFTMEPINDKYEIILHEASYLFWDGSHIDSIKLTDGTGKECQLLSAVHSKDGDVLSAIEKSDDVRVRSFPGDEIKLKYDGCSGKTFSFTIEGYNRKIMFEWLDITTMIPIVVILALVISVIIFGVLKFTKSKTKEPTPEYDEESSEQPFY